MRKFYYKKATKLISRFFGVPQYLIFYVTNDCMMKCRHCFYNDEFKNRNRISNDILTLNEIEKIAESIKKVHYLSVTGGEPFMRDDLTEIINLFTRPGKVSRYQMPTSGYDTGLIMEKTERMLKENKGIPFRVHVSLDGNEEIHDRIRNRKGAFKNAVETIKALRELKNKFSYFDVSIATTISAENQDIIKEIGDISESVLPDGEWCINLQRGANPEESSGTDPEKYLSVNGIIDKRISDKKYKGYSGHFSAKWLTAKNAARRKIIYRIMKNDYEGGGCMAGSVLGVIYPNGSVFPCEMTHEPIGNLRDYGYNLSALWNSESADRERNRIQDTSCLCTHECSLSINILTQPRAWYSLVRERLKV